MKHKNFEFVHHDDIDDDWYEVLIGERRVYTVRRREEYPYRWVAHDIDGEQCFTANQYRNDLFEEIVYESEFTE